MGDEQNPKWSVPRSQRARARTLRGNQTDAEQRLWSELRGHRFAGLSFRRQHPIGPYVADFVCLPARLVVEVDGGQHYEDAGRVRDGRRGAFLRDRGLDVLRFSNLDVLQNMSGVLETILAATRPPLADRGSSAVLPPPQPSPASGRGSEAGTNGKGPLPLAGEGWEGESARGAEQADQDKDDVA